MMKLFFLSLLAHQAVASSDVILNHNVMQLTNLSARFSALAYEEGPPQEEDMDSLHFFDDEPDQALVIKAHGYCFGVFRGTTLTWDDWSQNLEIGNKEICDDDADEKTCCTTRKGFFKAYDASYRGEVEKALKDCAESCKDKDECVVLTGHSQGGAIAAVAGVALASLNPYVITFGQPATILEPCERITSERWYRWVNTKDSESLSVGISYDPVPFVPGMGADNFGHMILISSDDTGVAYIGLNAQDYFGPLNVKGFEAHSMFGTKEFPGYADRVSAMMKLYDESGKYPIRDNGYIPGSYCTEDKECESNKCARETGFSWKRCVGTQCDSDDGCDSDRCDHGMCVPKLGSCQVCDENSDCASGLCSWRFRCAENAEGLMGNQCQCNVNADCVSGRCEGASPPICEPKLALGGSCNEFTDCVSGNCNWEFQCGPADAINKTRSLNALAIVGILAGLILVGCFIQKCFCKGRQGYDEIPSQVKD